MTECASTQYQPTEVSPPGATLTDLLEERALSQAELAERMGRPLKTINEIVKGKTAITRDTALQLERVLGAPVDFWLTREARYQEWLARREDWVGLRDSVDWLRELPVASMVKLGWIRRATTRVEQVSACLSFFGVATVEAWRSRYETRLAAFRTSAKVTSTAGAIAAWLRRGEIEAAQLACEPYEAGRFKQALVELRSLTQQSDPRVFVPQLVATCARCGVAVCLIPSPQGCAASGATRWLSPNKAILQLSLRHETNDHLWFTFFHEAGHIVRHGKKLLFVENVGGMDATLEREADRFASDLLIPPHQAKRMEGLQSKASVAAFAESVGIAPGIVVGRMQNAGLLPWSHLNGLKVSYDWLR